METTTTKRFNNGDNVLFEYGGNWIPAVILANFDELRYNVKAVEGYHYTVRLEKELRPAESKQPPVPRRKAND